MEGLLPPRDIVAGQGRNPLNFFYKESRHRLKEKHKTIGNKEEILEAEVHMVEGDLPTK